MPALNLDMAPMTELDAVNMLLLSIGQAPVNTLEVSGIRDVSIARLYLHNASRAVQSKGWSFNTEKEFPLTPDANGHIAVPGTALSLDPCRRQDDFVQRLDPNDSAMKLYDRENHTFEIDKPVDVDIVWLFTFEGLPQSARNYITVVAARQFQAQQVSSDILYRFGERDEAMALAVLTRDEKRVKNGNIFRSGARVNRIIHRNH